MSPATCPASLPARLPADVFQHLLTFAPLPTLRQCATVARRWTPITSRVMALHRRAAERYLTDGQRLMQAVLSPIGCIQLFQRAICIYPGLAEASYWLAKVLLILKKEPEAIDCLHHALRQHPNEVDEIKLRACLLYTKNDDLQASQLLEKALELAPGDACLHFELGFCYHGMQDFARAIASYTQALHLQYHRVFVLLANRANCLHWCGRMGEALQDLQRSLQISPHYELALRTRAHVYIDLGNVEGAAVDFTTIVENCTDRRAVSNAYFHRALCRAPLDERDLDRARKADPTNLDPVQHHASLLVQQHRLPEAAALLTEWIDANPGHPELADQFIFRAEVEEKGFEVEAAIEDYTRALQCLPRDASPGLVETCRERIQQLERLRDGERAWTA